MIRYARLVFLGTAAMLLAGEALADPMNEPPPAGPVILDLNGTPIPHQYQQYTVSFVAAQSTTHLSFAFREDPAFISLDDVTMADVTHPGGNLVTNGGFESGPVADNAPVGWTYLNIFGAEAAGIVDDNNPHSGSNNYYDGAVQAYDAISQDIATTVGDTYQIQFWLDDNGPYSTFSSLSTNGDVTDTGGNGVDLLVYAGALPTPATPSSPEPASIALLGAGLAGLGLSRRRKRN